MSHPSEDVVSKIDWADKHINDFRRAAYDFAGTDPYGTVVKTDPQTGKRVYTVTKMTPIPAHLRMIAGDAIQNLRSALDYLACGLVRMATKAEPSKYVCFPISESKPLTKEQHTAFSRQVKGMRQDAVDAIKAIKPYKGGNDALWRLYRLNIIDKHRLLMAAGTSLSLINPAFRSSASEFLTQGIGSIDRDATLPLRDRFPLKAGDTVTIDPKEPGMDQNPQFLLEIAFNEPGVAEGEVVLVVLKQSLRCVREIVGNLLPLIYS
jgi:hypothetical protein